MPCGREKGESDAENLGMFDLDDLMNNSLGAFLGWGCFTPPFANYLQSLNKWLLK